MTLVVDKVLEDQLAQGVNALVQTVAYNVKLVRGIDSEIKDLTSDIETFSARLIEASKNSWATDHHVLRVVVKKFRNVVNEAQDTIADYVALKGKHVDNVFSKSLDKIPFCGKINDFAREIESIRGNLAKIRQDHGQELLHLMTYKINEQNKCLLTLQVRPTIEKVFGFKKDLKTVNDDFIKASDDNFIVIPIVGITGSGKTIIASVIFEDQCITHKNFDEHIWVHVSQGFDRKQKFIDILCQITSNTKDISMMTEEGLAREICELLKDKKYFVVLDDVRKKEDWDSFKVAFPTNLKGSRVLVTSPYGNVVDSNWKSHKLGKLSNDEGWSLLKNSAFGTEECNENSLINLGKEIANKCNELPLALVAVGCMLRQRRNIADWQRVAENPFLEINREGQIYCDRVKMTYNDLPHEKLKNCFLYFAYFPMGHKIVVWKLICLWIAEEFIPTIDEQGYALDAEVEAKKYLNDLVDRNLVMVVEPRINGEIETCCIPDTLHEFCKSEGARINLFHVMDEGQRLDDDENTSSSSIPRENISSTRRLCFHPFSENRFDVCIKSYNQKRRRRSLCPFGKHIHSLLLFSSQMGATFYFTKEEIATIPNTYPLLRVLNIEFSINLKLQLNGLSNLHLLKYLAIKGNLDCLPKSFRSLRGLETLVIETTARKLHIDEAIWKMKKLRHVHTNISVQLPLPPKINSGGKDILTLSTISPTSCTEKILQNTPNLQKLGIGGDLSKFLKELRNGSDKDLIMLPPSILNARRLKKLTISATLYDWRSIFQLESLHELEVLKLDDYAFEGENWDLRCNDMVFKQLQYLHIGRTNLVTWRATEKNFPVLRSLILRKCSSLEKIPQAFANIHTLEVMELFHMGESAVQSAEEIQKNLKNCGFQLQLHVTNKMENEATPAGTDTMIDEAVSNLVEYVEWSSKWSGGPAAGLYSELKEITLDIETFNARLQEAYKNPSESVDVLTMVKTFRNIVNEAQDGACKYLSLNKTLIKCLVPRYTRQVESCESIIQSVRTSVNKIRHEHDKDLQSNTINRNNNNNVLLTLQIERPIGFDKVIEEVEQAVNMLVQTVGDNVNLVSDMTSQIKTLTESLVVACKSPLANQHRVLRVIVKKFRRLVNEARDAVAKYYFAQEKKHGLAKAFYKIRLWGKLNNVASEIQSIMKKVKTISQDHEEDIRHLQEDYNKRSSDQLPPPKVRAVLRENKILGFNEDFITIKTRLLKASNEFDVIPIVGNVGTGKTTFALKIFEDPEIRENFTTFIWVHVSRVFHRRQNFIDILLQIWKQTEDYFSTALENLLEDALEAKVKELLEEKRYFIVLDDVHVKDDWDCLKVAFPNNLKGSRVVVTTWSDNVVDSIWNSHSLGKLSNEDSWLLIKNDVFGTEGCHDTTLIEELGKKIAEKCNGLQHVVLLVAGILRNCITSDGWQRVANNLLLLDINGQDQSYHGLVKLSYHDLPNQGLKHCFLYFAYFSMGYEIVAWKLISLWIAEGFIPERDEWGNPLEVEVEAWKYLNVLVDRNLVMVKKRRADGEIKTCCIHDTLHEFCRSEVRGKSAISTNNGHTLSLRAFDVENNNNQSDSFSNLFNQRMGPRPGNDDLRSLLLSSSSASQNSEIPYSKPEMLEDILKYFKYVMVLNIESLKYSSLPNKFYSRLRNIRYLAITADITSLPKSFENLFWLQTLVIKTTTERALQIHGGIWNMENLRHVYINTSMQLPSPPKTGKHSRRQTNIRTLSTISPASCTRDIFSKTPKLQKLGVRGNFSQILEKKQKVCLFFNNLQMLEHLQNLKLHGNSTKVLMIPISEMFPRRLRKLTLSGTLFHWENMTVLGLLEKLKVLKLDDYAFVGKHWDLSSAVIFKGLQYLRIAETNLITWTAVESKKSFPVLESLVLRNCIFLQNIPQDFANVDSLKVIEVFKVSERVSDFAREICVKRHGKTNVKINGFNIFITPLPSQATAHNLAYENEYVNPSGFDYPSTSISSQEIEHNQAYGDENVNINGFEHPSTSTLSEEIVHKQSNGEENVNVSVFDHPNTSTSSQGIVHKQSNGEENVNNSEFDHTSTSTPSHEIVSDDD